MTKFRLSIGLEYLAAAAVFAGTLLLAILNVNENVPVLGVIRLLLGSLMTLFLPGYYLHLIFFPNLGQLDLIERLVFSFVFSLAIIPTPALILDTLGVPLSFTTILLYLAGVTAVFGIIAAWRRLRLPPEERFCLHIAFEQPISFKAQPRLARFFLSLLLIAFVVGGISLLLILSQPSSAERLTEFYLLGQDGFAEGFPRILQAGEAATFTVGIHNLEGVTVRYTYQVLDQQTVLYQSDTIQLEPNARYEEPITITPVSTGADVTLDFHLYREGDTAIYRALRFILDVELPR